VVFGKRQFGKRDTRRLAHGLTHGYYTYIKDHLTADVMEQKITEE